LTGRGEDLAQRAIEQGDVSRQAGAGDFAKQLVAEPPLGLNRPETRSVGRSFSRDGGHLRWEVGQHHRCVRPDDLRSDDAYSA
jgi:hypothetical protein